MYVMVQYKQICVCIVPFRALMLLVGRQDRHQIHKKFHANYTKILLEMWHALSAQKMDSKAKVECINTKLSVFMPVLLLYALCAGRAEIIPCAMCFRWNMPEQRQLLLHRLVVMLRMQ